MPLERIERHIYLLRGYKVMLDADLAIFYGVSTKRLNEQVSRNRARFPNDFMFQLTPEEAVSMRSQIATAPKRNIRYRPLAFTEHGAVMLASVLNSPVAVLASVQVVRAFMRLREILSTHNELAGKLKELEQRVQDHDGQIENIFDVIDEMRELPPEPPRKIGFRTD